MSGAGVVLPGLDGRLVGIVVTAEVEHQQRRLYLVPIADALTHAPGLGPLLRGLGGPAAVEARSAPRYRAVLQARCLGPDGLPVRVGEVTDLAVFGVKPADLPGEQTYLDYVPRDGDQALRAALAAAARERRMLLVVGGSAAGKSRSAAEAARTMLANHWLLCPRATALPAVLDLPLADLTSSLVWLDDVERYAHAALADTLQRLLGTGLVVVSTIRRAQLDVLAG